MNAAVYGYVIVVGQFVVFTIKEGDGWVEDLAQMIDVESIQKGLVDDLTFYKDVLVLEREA